MPPELLDLMPMPQRLALAWSPARTRGPLTALLAFDAALGTAIRRASTPIMSQLRLAWWRDQLRLESEKRVRSDAIVVALDQLAGMRGALLGLIDGWEHILAEDLDNAAIEEFASGRGRALAALARLVDAPDTQEAIERAGQRWALADLACGLGSPEERALALAAAKELGAGRIALSRQMRTLAVLDGLARRSLAQGGTPLLAGPVSGLVAIRLGLIGQ